MKWFTKYFIPGSCGATLQRGKSNPAGKIIHRCSSQKNILFLVQRWEFIKENKKTFDQESDQEKNKKERKHALDQESDQEKTITVKKERKHGLDQESDFLLSCFLL